MSLDADATVHGAFFARATDPRWADATALWARPDDDDAASLGIAVGTTGVDASSCRARVSFRALLDASLALAEAMTRDDHPGTFRRSGPPRSRASDGALLADATAAVLIDSSETLIVAYFACLFAGRAFAPVETALPPAARAGVLRTLAVDAGLTHVLVPSAEDARAVARDLATAPHAESPPSSSSSSVAALAVRASPTHDGALDVRVTSLDADHPLTPLRRRLDDRAWSSVFAADASCAVAHVIHTGGTTGAPKAVLCDHRGSILSHAARAAAMPFTPDDITGVLVFGVWDAVCALLAGSSVAMLPGGVLREGAEATARAMVDANATRVTLTPSLAALLVAQAEDEQTTTEREGETSAECREASGSSRRFAIRALRNLRAATLCGESVSPALAASLRGKIREGATLANLYSLSEAHDVALETEDAAGGGCGAPYPHVTVRVADVPDFCVKESRARDFFQPREFASSSESPSCTSGYVYLGGPALALGYLGAGGASANASRFGVDANGARWYATGDRATLRADGRIRLLGRGGGATEAKVRGARVDLVAAEEALRAHPEVAECACVARRIVVEESNGREGSRRDDDDRAATVVAFVVRRTTHRDDASVSSDFEEDARAWMLARVPSAAVPSRVVTLERLPLTAVAGSSAPKRDRRALETVVLPERRRGRDRRDPKENDDEEDERVARMTALAARVMRETLPSRDGDSDEDADPDLGFAASGGASLAAQRILAALRREDATWRALTPADLMAADTPRRAAAAAAAKHRGAACGSARSGGTDVGIVSRSACIPRGALSTEEMFDEASAFARDALEARGDVGGFVAADPRSPRCRSFVVSRAGGIFLTGATGLLGGALAREILRVARPDATLFCLARAEDDAAASTRVSEALADPDSGVVDPRVRAIAGDASERHFGLPHETYARLASEIDLVVHAAGSVHALAPYASMRSSNATPAREAARLAATRPGEIGLAHVSSSAVLPPVGARGDARNPAGAAEETDAAWASRRPEFARFGSTMIGTGTSGRRDIGSTSREITTFGWGERETSGVDALTALASSGGYDTAEAHGGTYQAYAQAKWVAETVVWTAARDAGVPAVVIRPGNVAPRSDDGKGWRRDATMALATATAATGATVAQTGWWRLWWTPVDVVARAVVAAANASELFRTGIAHHVDPVDPVDAARLVREIRIAARRRSEEEDDERRTAIDPPRGRTDEERRTAIDPPRGRTDDDATSRVVDGVASLRETLREALRRDGDASDPLLFRLPPATAAVVEATLEAASGLEGALGLCERRMDVTETRRALGPIVDACEEREKAFEIIRAYARAAAASFDYTRHRREGTRREGGDRLGGDDATP